MLSVEAIALPLHLRLVAPNIDTMVRRAIANVGDSFPALTRFVTVLAVIFARLVGLVKNTSH